MARALVGVLTIKEATYLLDLFLNLILPNNQSFYKVLSRCYNCYLGLRIRRTRFKKSNKTYDIVTRGVLLRLT